MFGRNRSRAGPAIFWTDVAAFVEAARAVTAAMALPTVIDAVAQLRSGAVVVTTSCCAPVAVVRAANAVFIVVAHAVSAVTRVTTVVWARVHGFGFLAEPISANHTLSAVSDAVGTRFSSGAGVVTTSWALAAVIRAEVAVLRGGTESVATVQAGSAVIGTGSAGLVG